MSEQLQFDINRACRRLADQLKDYRVIPTAGAERLLKALVQRTDLDETTLLPAAALVLQLELDTARKASAVRSSARVRERVTASTGGVE